MAERNKEISVTSLETLTPTSEQEKRLNDINSIDFDSNFKSTYANYIETGNLPDGYTGRLKDIKVKVEQNNQDTDISDLLFKLIDRGII